MCLIFVGQGYPRKLFNLEHFPIYGIMFNIIVYPLSNNNNNNRVTSQNKNIK